ncbi:MAG: TIGR03435 family protein [Bryobacteraceae bacterium]
MRFPKFIGWAILGGMALASSGAARAQPSEGFEVASIKPSRNSSAEPNLDSRPSGRLTATNITAGYLIRLAFGVKDYQIAGAPAWVDKQEYDIAAKTVDGARKTSYEDLQSLLRQLLVDRFQLQTHRETKPGSVYLLVVGKNGPKLTPHNDGTGSRTRKGCGHLAGTRLTMDTLATVLSRQFERDVLNRTGLPGKYDFQLDWTPDSGPCPPPADGQGGSTASAYQSDGTSVFATIQAQLGLKLESSKGPVEILIVDRVERPSGN